MRKTIIRTLVISVLLSAIFLTAACSSSGGGGYSNRTAYHGGVGVGYGGYYGRPWGHHPGYIGGIDPGPGIGGGGPVAAQMPDMGMPDYGGGMDMGMGMGGFDDF
jgi:hypothetical protein